VLRSCHLAKSNSVRDIFNGMRSATENLNHLGIQKASSKSTISYQYKHRNHHLFQDYYFALLNQLGQHKGSRHHRVKLRRLFTY